MNVPLDLVYIDKYNLLGSNFYWHNYGRHGLTKQDILNAGLTSDRVQVDRILVDKLTAVDEALKKRGWRLYVKEGYRSSDLYDMIYKRRVEKYGKEQTDSILNMKDRPHTLGLSVDVSIYDEKEGQDVLMRRREDGVDAFFIGYYRDKEGVEEERYQELQSYLASLMLAQGFRIGTRREFFHFDYRPDTEPNYD